jgi:putative phosphoribosyl transferase
MRQPGVQDDPVVFDDRRDAGRRLAALLLTFAAGDPIVVGLLRGGVPVGVEVAHALGAPLDVLAVRKLGAPGNPELGIGALAEDGTAVVNAEMARRLGVTQERIDEALERAGKEIRRRVERFREGRPPTDVRGRTALVVDDGLATGLTDLAAVRALRRRGASTVVVAAPVGSREAIALLRHEADDVVCHTIPRQLLGIGAWYRDFSQLSDDEVVALLSEAGAS